jgi:hypothetical protein
VNADRRNRVRRGADSRAIEDDFSGLEHGGLALGEVAHRVAVQTNAQLTSVQLGAAGVPAVDAAALGSPAGAAVRTKLSQ